MATRKKTVEAVEAPVSVEETVEVVDVTAEAVEPVEELSDAPVHEFPPPTHIIKAREGDSYASLAVKYADGRKAHAYAKELYALNNGAVIRPGSRVKIK